MFYDDPDFTMSMQDYFVFPKCLLGEVIDFQKECIHIDALCPFCRGDEPIEIIEKILEKAQILRTPVSGHMAADLIDKVLENSRKMREPILWYK